MDELAARVAARGALVAGRLVQRRGVSDGGVRKMTWPYSRRTLVSAGKVQEIAAACQATGAGAVIFLNDLTGHQREVLEEGLGRPVFSRSEFTS